jgi:magnesium transporter
MQKLVSGVARKAGMIPGTLVHVGEEGGAPVRVTAIRYSLEQVEELVVTDLSAFLAAPRHPGVTWVNVEGVHDVSIIQQLGDHFGLHPLLQEDVANTEQRPKLEDYGDFLFLVLRMLYEQPSSESEDLVEIDSEQVSLVLGTDVVITFLEDPQDVFEPVRNRIRDNRGRVRKSGADYLLYALVDVIVDNYFTALERFSDLAEALEVEVMGEPSPATLPAIQQMKRAMIQVRRAIWPLRDVVSALLRGESRLVKKATVVYLRDVYDHVVRVVDIVETYREMVGGLMDIYLSTLSNRMNEVMKVLTIIATIFIPLTFIAGVYGMNFENIPELHWRHGYWYVWLVMLVSGVTLLVFFRRKKWL